MSDFIKVFNRHSLQNHRDRAAAHLEDFDFLYAEAAERLADRLEDITRSFPMALDLGCHGGEIGRLVGKRGKIETLIQSDLSLQMAKRAGNSAFHPRAVNADEEFMPFADNSFDLVISNLSLHWVNDLPGTLLQIRRALKPDGLFLASMFGAGTLYELGEAMAEAEVSVEGGLSPRVSPFADLQTLGGLLQRAGFALPVADSEEITVSYPEPFKLMKDLRGMGETNAVGERRTNFIRRETLMKAAELYQERFTDEDGRIPATFQVITLTAWAPAPTQQQPLKPGSADSSLADFLKS